MTDEQAYNYLLKKECLQTWNQIIKKTGRSYEDLREIYNTACLPEIRKRNEERKEEIKSTGSVKKERSCKSNTGITNINKLQNGQYSVKLYRPIRKIRTDTLQQAIDLRNENLKNNKKV